MTQPKPQTDEPLDGDWCLVDLSEPITEEATKHAHALGMNFHDFMCEALEEKLLKVRGSFPLDSVRWEASVK